VSETEVRPRAQGPEPTTTAALQVVDRPQITGYGEAAPIYLERGWVSPLPLEYRTKAPLRDRYYTGHEGKIPTLDGIHQWMRDRPSDNLAIRMPSDVIGIDVDAYKDKKGARTLAEGERRYGRLREAAAIELSVSTAAPSRSRSPANTPACAASSAT
jgi:Bifunctional DNA primase/polymerase, N-terminal